MIKIECTQLTIENLNVKPEELKTPLNVGVLHWVKTECTNLPESHRSLTFAMKSHTLGHWKYFYGYFDPSYGGFVIENDNQFAGVFHVRSVAYWAYITPEYSPQHGIPEEKN